jgi:hypothetical protein
LAPDKGERNPELDLVVLMQAGNYSDGRTRNEFRDRYMGKWIMPAALAWSKTRDQRP